MPDPTLIVGDGALPPRARFATDAPVLSLNGEWRFQLSPTVADAPAGSAIPPSTTPAGGPSRCRRAGPWPGTAPRRTRTPSSRSRSIRRIRPTRTRSATSAAGSLGRRPGACCASTASTTRGEVWLNGTRLGSTRGSRLRARVRRDGRPVAGENLLVLRVAPVVRDELPRGPGHVVAARGLPGRDPAGRARPAASTTSSCTPTGPTGAGALRVDAETRDGAPRPSRVPVARARRPRARRGAPDRRARPVDRRDPRPRRRASSRRRRRDRDAPGRLPHDHHRGRAAQGERAADPLPRREPARAPPRPRPGDPAGGRAGRAAAHEAAQRERDPHLATTRRTRPAGARRRARLLPDRRVRPRDARVHPRRLARQPERRPGAGSRPTSTGCGAPSRGTGTTRA